MICLQFYPLLLLYQQQKHQYSGKDTHLNSLNIIMKIVIRSQKPPGVPHNTTLRNTTLFYNLFQEEMWNLRITLQWKWLQASHTWKWVTSLPRQRKMPTALRSWWNLQRRHTQALWCKALLELYQTDESCWLKEMHLKRESSLSRKHLHRNAFSCPWGILIKRNTNQQWYVIGKKAPWDYF